MLLKAPKLPRHNIEQRRLIIVQSLMSVVAAIAVAVLIMNYGFYLLPQSKERIKTAYLVISILFVSGGIAQLLIAQDRRVFFRATTYKHIINAVVLLELLLAAILWPFADDFSLFGLLTLRSGHYLILQLYIVFTVTRGFARFSQKIAQYNASPARFIVISFGSAIVIGAGLLLLPTASTTSLHPLDALFTATSAICVTGLIVVDTATAFTKIGQLIILSLIQLGGLGIMTVTAFFSLMIGQRMSGREQVLMGNVLSTDRPANLSSVIRAVFWTTIVIEAIGFLLLYSAWNDSLPSDTALYSALFHTISAFCNAGFSTFSDSLISYSTNFNICLTICGLIILGGLGFETLRNFFVFVQMKTFRKKRFRFSVQSKVVLIMTALLLISGTMLFLILEFRQTLAAWSLQNRLLNAFFQSVTFRTAGFNTVDFSQVKESTLILGVLWMFIGAAPGSTGGGIKVTTLAILLGTVYASSRGKTRLELFRRTIPVKVLYQTLVVITVYLSVAVFVSFCLSLTEPDVRPIELIFETISALGTVGLSAGITPSLSATGKALIILTMFLGRIGPFTLALAIGQKQLTANYTYPEEEVQIG